MGKIIRDPESASKRSYDLIIIGGGIYGVMLAYEASKRNLQALLLEKNDFGGATTFNFLRILHGGFRYLQTFDFYRFRESVAERKWFLKNFPNLVKPLPCLMPLYGDGLRRPMILRVATCLNDFLSYYRNNGVGDENHLPFSTVLGPEETRQVFPDVDGRGLKGSVVWYDALMSDSQIVLMEILKKSCNYGCSALNYVEAQRVIKINNHVVGIVALDTEADQTYEFKSRVIINAAGPWCRELAAGFDIDLPKLFISSLAWNVLLNRNSLSSHALAIAPKKQQARTYFLLPWKGKILAGTGHAPGNGTPDDPKPSPAMIEDFLSDLNLGIPTLQVNLEDVLHVFSGLLPVTEVGSVHLTNREIIHDHSLNGGPSGLYSVSGVKFTTARRVAEKVIARIFSEMKPSYERDLEDFSLTQKESSEKIFDYSWQPDPQDETWKNPILEIVENEAVVHIDDLLFRRSTLWENQQRCNALSMHYGSLFGWDKVQCMSEIERIKKIFALNLMKND